MVRQQQAEIAFWPSTHDCRVDSRPRSVFAEGHRATHHAAFGENMTVRTPPFRDRFLPFVAKSGFHRLCYREWGDAGNPKVLICVHGLSRNRLDFDTLAAALAADYRVLAVDMPGRGGSDWLVDAADYNYPYFRSLLASLIAVSGAETVDWVGTSMGGILGMVLASLPRTPIRRMVLNDIGPFISGASRAANTNKAAAAAVFGSEQEAIDFVLESRKSFGPFTPEAADKFARDSLMRSADGQWRLHYDPRIIYGRDTSDADMWATWDRISCPVLTIWGVESILLSADTVERMRVTGPRSAVHAMPGIGHCPGLTSAEEIDRLRSFLLD